MANFLLPMISIKFPFNTVMVLKFGNVLRNFTVWNLSINVSWFEAFTESNTLFLCDRSNGLIR